MDKPPARHALIALLVVTIIWGWTFSWIKQAIDSSVVVLGPGALTLVAGLFMTVRFGLSAIVMPWVVPKVRPHLRSAAAWRDGGIIGGILLGGFLLQMFGLKDIDPAVSAFLTSLYVAFTAIMSGAMERKWPSWSLVVGVLVVTTGAATISGPPQLTFDTAEWLTVLCAVLFAAHIVATDRVTQRTAPLGVAWTSFVWVALGSSVLLLVGKAQRPDIAWSQALELLQTPAFLVPTLLAAFLGTLLALTLLTYYQKVLSPVRAAILYALEPVWAAIISVAVGLTDIGGWLLFGGSALLMGNLFVEIWPRLAKNRSKQAQPTGP